MSLKTANKVSPALMIKAEDIERLLSEWQSVSAWVKAHVFTRLPPHRYRGELALEERGLVFRGTDVSEDKEYQELIPFSKIKEISLEFDGALRQSFDRAFGSGGPVPLTIVYERNDRPQTAYFNTDFNRYPTPRNYPNQEWYDLLKVKLVTHRNHGNGNNRHPWPPPDTHF
ncbi:MAG: hypothetical protein V1823_01980 [Chloroflexota bacterium]